MATYPVIHKETGEQKSVVMSVHDWINGVKTIPNGRGIGLTHLPALLQQKLGIGKINFVNLILVGMMFLVKSKKHLVQT